ncbi:unnamed protein product [Linum trigynum]|uniref:Uncharacterized protein n=1 Tax=Linum trigynum TaxID=586398 RepID=A0AAV2GT92_9ROSI
MSAEPPPPAGGGSGTSHQTDTSAGQRRPPTESSSPNPKGDREAQHAKKKAKQTYSSPIVEEIRDEVLSDAEAELSPTPQLDQQHGLSPWERLGSCSARQNAWTNGT